MAWSSMARGKVQWGSGVCNEVMGAGMAGNGEGFKKQAGRQAEWEQASCPASSSFLEYKHEQPSLFSQISLLLLRLPSLPTQSEPFSTENEGMNVQHRVLLGCCFHER